MTVQLRFARSGDRAVVRANGDGLGDVAVADREWERADVAEGISQGWLVTLRRFAGQTRPVEGDRLKYDNAADLMVLLGRRLDDQGPWWEVPGDGEPGP